MANYYYGTLQLRGPQGALEKLTAQLEQLKDCCLAYGDADTDYLPAMFEDYPLEEGVFCDGWRTEEGYLEIYTRGRGTVGNRFAAILCQSLGLSGTLSVEAEMGGEEQFKFSFDDTVPVCTLRKLGPNSTSESPHG